MLLVSNGFVQQKLLDGASGERNPTPNASLKAFSYFYQIIVNKIKLPILFLKPLLYICLNLKSKKLYS